MPPADTLVTPAPGAAAAPAGGGAGAAAPAAPPASGGTQAAVDAARERLAKSGTIFPEGTKPELEEPIPPEAGSPEAVAAAAAAAAAAAETPEEKADREAAEAAAGAPGALEIVLEAEGGEKITFTAPDQATFDALTSALTAEP